MQKFDFLSVVFSFRNEEAVLRTLIERVTKVLKSQINVGTIRAYELVFVNDSSTDGSLTILKQAAEMDKNIRVLNMSRRFGMYECLFAGLRYAQGDGIVYMDADLQDPPELLPELIARWKDGHDLVYTTRNSRKGEPFLKKLITAWAYRFLNAKSDVPLTLDSGDYRLMSRRFVEHLLAMEDREPYFRGMTDWLGFSRAQVFYDREERVAGHSQRGLFTGIPFQVFQAAIISFSDQPLTSIIGVGIFSFCCSIVLTMLTLLHLLPSVFYWASFLFFLTGVHLVALGIVALYISRMHRILQNRPLYLVESKIGFKDRG